MAYRIKLTPYTPSRVKLAGRDTFRLRIVASNGEDMPNEIFLHQRTLIDAVEETTRDEFVCIASAFDMSIYPINDPEETQSPAFFRKDTMDIYLPSVTVVDEVIDEVEAQVAALINVMRTLDELSALEPIWIPDESE